MLVHTSSLRPVINRLLALDRGKMNKLIKTISACLLSALLGACGSNAMATTQTTADSVTNQNTAETIGTQESTTEVKVEKNLSGVYTVIGATARDTAASMLQIDTLDLNAEIHFNADNTGVFMYGDEVFGFTYDSEGHMIEDTSGSAEEEPVSDMDKHNMDFVTKDDYVVLFQTRGDGLYEGVMVFKRTAD